MNPRTATTGVQWYLVNDKTQTVLRGPEESRTDLFSERGQPAGTRVVKVNPGTILVRAAVASTKGPPPNRWYALNDNPSLKGTDITNPEQNFSNGTGGAPDVTFSFTDSGATKWHNVTRTIVQRAQALAPPTPCQTPDCREFSHHFAASLDNALITVPVHLVPDQPGRDPGQRLGDLRQLHDPERAGPRQPAEDRRPADQAPS